MSNRSRTLAFLPCFALFALACSGTTDRDDDDDDMGRAGSGNGTPMVPAYCEESFGPTDPTALVDDMEDRDPLIAEVIERNGSWWIASDETAGTVTPPANQAPIPELIPGGRCEDSRYAMRVTGQGFTEWGAVLVAGLRYTTEPSPVDLSEFSGVMFWARVGETHNSPVRVQFQDASTQPEGGQCDPAGSVGTECYDGWGTALQPISTEWRLYQIDFSRMRQREFGFGGEAMDTSAVYSIEFNLAQNTVFDLWIDDVWLYE